MKSLKHTVVKCLLRTAFPVFLTAVSCLAAETTNAPAADLPPQPYGARDFRPGASWLDDQGVAIDAHSAGILVHEETYYWFGEIRQAVKREELGRVSVYSSKDLYNWKNEGVALRGSQDPKSDIGIGSVIERPKVIYNKKTGKFVMWFHLELAGKGYLAARSGVAVADKVTGPYTYLGSMRPNAGVWPENVAPELKTPVTEEELAATTNPRSYKKDFTFRRDFAGGQMARDMNLFVDDDGTAYHIYASEENATLHISQLSDNYLIPAGKYYRILPGKSNEAPAIFKHQGKYYLFTSGTTGWNPNPGRLASADSIIGPWQELGNPCVGTDEDKKTTFHSQSTFVLPVIGKPGAFIYLGDRWLDPSSTRRFIRRYIWLPILFDSSGKPYLQWKDQWDLSTFK